MNRIFVTVLTGWALLAAGSAIAGKVNMPHDGNFEFDFCALGTPRTMAGADKVFVMNYKVVASLLTEPSGKAFDQMSSLCYGQFTNLNGKLQDGGVCELTDQDGDKWWMDYHGNAEGTGGTYTAVHGTGKYEGMTVKGQYILGYWPAAEKDTFQGCNHNKGTYKLK